jgi:XrtJ-associated TM-motif-TM protein
MERVLRAVIKKSVRSDIGRKWMRSMIVFLGCALLLAIAMPLRAQTGCADSPENPTAVLALLGGVGALWSAVRKRR